MSKPRFEITVDANRKCVKCGRGGAMDDGYCMECVAEEAARRNFEHVPKDMKDFASQALRPRKESAMSDRIELESCELTDIHPKIKHVEDGVIRWVEIKVKTLGFSPEQLQDLAKIQGASCKVTIAPIQLKMAGME